MDGRRSRHYRHRCNACPGCSYDAHARPEINNSVVSPALVFRAAPRGDPSLARLFRRCSRFHDPAARNELIRRFGPLATGLARRYYVRGGEPLEDLVQVALIGLIKAIDRYDPERGVTFVSFAEPTIRGELRRHFRDATWAIHVPRKLQERVALVERATERLSAELGRSPTLNELADACDLDPQDAIEALHAARSSRPQLLQAGAEAVARDPGFELVEYTASARGAVAELSARDRLVLQLRIAEGLSQREIARRVGVSQMQVSRILARTLTRLREAAGVDPA
jgi:RNA polymerase sigma-B factor